MDFAPHPQAVVDGKLDQSRVTDDLRWPNGLGFFDTALKLSPVSIVARFPFRFGRVQPSNLFLKLFSWGSAVETTESPAVMSLHPSIPGMAMSLICAVGKARVSCVPALTKAPQAPNFVSGGVAGRLFVKQAPSKFWPKRLS